MTNNKKLLNGLLITVFLLVGVQANADLVLTPGGATYFGVGSGGLCAGLAEPTDCDGPGTSHVLGWLDANLTGFDSSEELYKRDLDSATDAGSFADSYNSSFSSDASSGRIFWLEVSPITDPKWLFVKDGDNEPVWYLFDISSWDGMMTISLSGFWPSNGAISHVSIYGGDVSVPEPGTLALFGLGLLGLRVTRRRRKA